MLIVGSKALLYNFPELDRAINDVDVIANKNDYLFLKSILNPTKVVEKESIISLINIRYNASYPMFSTKNVEILLYDNSVSLKGYVEYEDAFDKIKYASIEVIFSLKKSHIHFPIKFNKHINDYLFLNEKLSGKDKLHKLTKINYKETEDRLGKLKTPSLNKSVKEFFNQSEGYVKSYFVHDDLHKVMAHYDEPLYLKMQYDKSLAKCEKVLWDKFTLEEKCKCVLEEAYVIALERRILPMIFGGGKYISNFDALKWSMMRICTTLCSGWFREFATNNYDKIFKYYNESYVELFLHKFDNNEINKI